MKSDARNGSGLSRWIENDGYYTTDAARGKWIARLAQNADTVAVISSRSIDPVLAEKVSCASRCYIITSERKEIWGREGQEAGPYGSSRHGQMTLTNMLVRFVDGFGANVVLTDPRSSSPRGLFLSSSLDPDAIRCDRLLYVRLKPSEISEMWQIVRWAFWEHASGELRDGGNIVDCSPLGALNLPKPAHILRSDVRDRGIKAAAKSILRDGTSSVIVAAPTLDASHWIVRRLCELADIGTRITVMTSTCCPADAASTLKGAGIRVLGFSCLHVNAIATEKCALLMPPVEAWSGPGLEFGLLLKDNRAVDVRKIMRKWEKNYQYEFE